MGLIDRPRAYFKGFTYWNPSTMNNNDYQPVYDPANARLNWPWIEQHGLQNPDDFDRYAITPTLATANSTADIAVVSGIPPAEWNYHGGNQCGFVGPDAPVLEQPENFTRPAGSLGVTGYTNPEGKLVESGDPWIGLPLRINRGQSPAKLVDVDPVCPWSSQIFADSLTLGDAAGGAGFAGATAGRAHSRLVFFQRNANTRNDVLIAGVGSAAFQFGLPRDGITIFDPAPLPGSLTAAVQHSLKQPRAQGLMVRLVTYLTIYFQGPAFPPPHQCADCFAAITRLYAEYAEQLASYRRGTRATEPAPPVNRAYSHTVGWIAPWMQGELRSAPGGRLLGTAAPNTVVAPAGITSWPLGPALVETAVDPQSPHTVTRVSIDLGSTTPEYDGAGKKIDFGTLCLGIAPLDNPNAPIKTFAAIPFQGGYDTAAYERTAGVVDIPSSAFTEPLSARELSENLIVGWFENGGASVSLALQEIPYTAQTDDRGVYLNEPDAPWSDRAHDPRSVSVQVRYLGGRPPAHTQLGVGQYAPGTPGFNEGNWVLVDAGGRPDAQTPYVRLLGPAGAEGSAQLLLDVPLADDAPSYATVTFGLRAVRPGPAIIVFYPHPRAASELAWRPPPKVGFGQITTALFANARVLPFQNEMALAFENWLRTAPTIDVVSQRVFDEVFRTFYLMYPTMRFLSDPLRFQARRGQIVAVTDPARFESGGYMPVTRSLTAGQRRILELWNDYANGVPLRRPEPSPRMRRG